MDESKLQPLLAKNPYAKAEFDRLMREKDAEKDEAVAIAIARKEAEFEGLMREKDAEKDEAVAIAIATKEAEFERLMRDKDAEKDEAVADAKRTVLIQFRDMKDASEAASKDATEQPGQTSAESESAAAADRAGMELDLKLGHTTQTKRSEKTE